MELVFLDEIVFSFCVRNTMQANKLVYTRTASTITGPNGGKFMPDSFLELMFPNSVTKKKTK
jgi:hypothetical protein